MRHHKKVWLASSILALALVGYISAPAFAEDDKDRPHQRRHHQDDDQGDKKGQRDEHREKIHALLFKDIDLTEEQQEQVRAIHQETRAAHKEWREAHQDEIDAIHAEMKQARENKDKEAMKAAHEKMRKLMESAPGPRQALDRIADEVLTDDQRPQFEENRKKVKEMIEEHRKQRHGHRCGQGDRDKDDDDRP